MFLAVKHLGFDDIHDFRQRGNVQFFSLCPKLTAIFQLANCFNRFIYFCKLKAREDWAKLAQ